MMVVVVVIVWSICISQHRKPSKIACSTHRSLPSITLTSVLMVDQLDDYNSLIIVPSRLISQMEPQCRWQELTYMVSQFYHWWLPFFKKHLKPRQIPSSASPQIKLAIGILVYPRPFSLVLVLFTLLFSLHIPVRFRSRSSMHSQNSSAAVWARHRYSDSVEESATMDCFLEHHDTGLRPKYPQYTVIDLWSSGFPTQSASQ